MTDLIVVPKTTEQQRLKALVLDSVSSPITRRVYLGLDEFIAWYTLERRPGAPPPADLALTPKIKLAFASGTEDLNRRRIEHLRALYPELPLWVVADFPPEDPARKWIRYRGSRFSVRIVQ